MAHVLAVLCSGRDAGYTAGLLDAAIESMGAVAGVVVERVRAHDYAFSPCTSCFACIRDPKHRCVLDDDMGRRGKGELFRKVIEANGLILADPVHLWGASAMCHLFFERLYPAVWSGELNGMPFMSISCATNQGMQHVAVQSLCRWAFTKGMRYVGQIAAHASHYDQSMDEAQHMAPLLAHAAREDAQGRQAFASDTQRFLAYADKPWDPVENYFHNLTRGTMAWEDSLPEQALQQGTFADADARDKLQQASPLLRKALEDYLQDRLEPACEGLAEASAYWTHATWAEFLEKQAIKTTVPAAYRPLSDPDDQDGELAGPAEAVERLTIYIDGASRGNPGPSAAGVAVCDGRGRLLESHGKLLGRGTNNRAEYGALLLGLRRAIELGAQAVSIRADSELLVRQMQGSYKVKSATLKPLAAAARTLLEQLEEWDIDHVPREENSAADGLANRALDEGRDFVERA